MVGVVVGKRGEEYEECRRERERETLMYLKIKLNIE